MSDQEDRIDSIVSNFEDKYNKVLLELDSLHKGRFDEEEAPNIAALCLIAQASLLKDLAEADLKSRSLKRDIDFAKAKAYFDLKEKPIDGKKASESALAQLVLLNEDVKNITQEQNEAERDFKYLTNIHSLLKEAHLTFRSIKKGVQ